MAPRPTTRGRNSPNRNRSALVLGAGAVGLSCAWFLRRSGRSVRVLDSGPPGHGATRGTAGLVCPAHSAPLPGPGVLGKALRWSLRDDSPFHIRWRVAAADPALLRWLIGFARACSRARSEAGFQALHALSSLSLARFRELTETGVLDFFFQQRGGWFVYETPDGIARARQEAAMLRENGVACASMSGDEIREREPALSRRITGGLLASGDAHGLSLGFAEAMARALAREGVGIESGVRVERLVRDGNRTLGAEVRTQEGKVEQREADETILALGARSPEVARTAGVRLPIQPAKGYSATFRAWQEAPGTPGMPALPVTSMDSKVIATPLGDRFRFAGTLELAGWKDEGINERRYRKVVESGRALLREPGPPMEDEVRWMGMRPLTPDALPRIGRPPKLDGLLVAAGHGTLGFTQSLGTGQLIAELADAKPPSIDPTPFHLPR